MQGLASKEFSSRLDYAIFDGNFCVWMFLTQRNFSYHHSSVSSDLALVSGVVMFVFSWFIPVLSLRCDLVS